MAVDASIPVGANPVTGAIRKAAQATGTSFDYLLATAKVESDLDPNLAMRSSTATGLFQFIEQTWLATLKQAGPAFGYGGYANAISRSASGRYLVADPALRDEIMRLRKDPAANALMGGVFTQQNAAVMSSRLGRRPSEGELYIGHFFGPYAGAKAITLAASNPDANAAEIFPAAAHANRPIFYDKQGQARSISGVCAELVRRYQVARADTRTPRRAAAAACADPARHGEHTPARSAVRAQGCDDRADGIAGRDGVCGRRQCARAVVEWDLAGADRGGRRHVSFAIPNRAAARGGRARDHRIVERRPTNAGRMAEDRRQMTKSVLRRPASAVRSLRFMVNALLRLAH